MTNLCNTLIEGFIKKTYEEKLPVKGTGLIIYGYGDIDQPKLAWGRASSDAYAYGMRNYKDLAKVRANGGDVSEIRARKEKNGGGYDDGIIDIIEEQKGMIWVHSFLPTPTKTIAIDMKEWMYENGTFSAKVMRYTEQGRPEGNFVFSSQPSGTDSTVTATEEDTDRKYIYDL